VRKAKILTSDVSLTSESTHVALITLEDGNVPGSIVNLVVSVLGSRHPVQGTIDTRGLEVALTGMEVGDEQVTHTRGLICGSLIRSVDVQAISSE
jgi:hypothetical protein